MPTSFSWRLAGVEEVPGIAVSPNLRFRLVTVNRLPDPPLFPYPSLMWHTTHFTVNGDRRDFGVPGHWTLLETLRYGLGLTGSKQGCDKGDCGACTVLLDGEPTLSCITPALEAEGREVTTVEGLSNAHGAHPLQTAFGERGAAQCGFCTPGILMSAAALLARTTEPTRQEIKEALSGNLCRCTGYTKILEAVELAAVRMRELEEPGEKRATA
jgi:aerobic-type carbon monoxide dehydrogenase small subunit (CoxS/CutS family)